MIKNIKLMIIFFLASLLISAFPACNMDSKNEAKVENINYFKDIEKYASVISTNELEIFRDEVKDYKFYYDEFFKIWIKNMEVVTPVLEAFNNETYYNNKIAYSQLLEQQYYQLLAEIKILNPPEIAEKSHELAVIAIKKRVDYFNAVKKGNFSEISHIENEAYLYEAMFWDELDEIFNRFSKRAADLGLDEPLSKVYVTGK